MSGVGGITLAGFRLYYKAIVIRRIRYCQRTDTHQGEKTENPNINPCTDGQLINNKRDKNIEWRKDSLQWVVLGKLDRYMQKNNIWTFSDTISKNELKMDWRPKCKTSSCKTPRGNHRTLFSLSHSNSFFWICLLKKIKAINNLDLIKLKIFCTAKETTDKMKRQTIKWEKIFANNKTIFAIAFANNIINNNKGLIDKYINSY